MDNNNHIQTMIKTKSFKVENCKECENIGNLDNIEPGADFFVFTEQIDNHTTEYKICIDHFIIKLQENMDELNSSDVIIQDNEGEEWKG